MSLKFVVVVGNTVAVAKFFDRMSSPAHWVVIVATFSLTAVMEGESSISGSDTVMYEDFCCLNNIPLCLKKGANAVPERTGEYSFVFLVLPRVPGMLSPVEEPSSNDSVLDETLHALVGTVESSNSIVADSFDSPVRDFDISLFN